VVSAGDSVARPNVAVGQRVPGGKRDVRRACGRWLATRWRHDRRATLAVLVAALVAVGLLVAASSSGPATEPPVRLGQVVYDDGIVFRVAGVTCGLTHLGSRDLGTTAVPGNQWCIAAVGVANTTTSTQGFAAWDQYAVDSRGRILPADTSAIPYLTGDGQALYASLSPGAVVGVRIPFELPQSSRLAAFELHDSAISTAVTVENER
jgi:hypothetical protein